MLKVAQINIVEWCQPYKSNVGDRELGEIEEARWLVVKAMLDEFPELRAKISEYLSQQPIRKVGRTKMRKRAVIVVSLVEESAEKPNKDIERELSKYILRMPWCQRVQSIKICHEGPNERIP